MRARLANTLRIGGLAAAVTLLILAAGPGIPPLHGGEDGPAQDTSPPAAPGAAGVARALRAVSPVFLEIAELHAASRARRQELQVRLASASDPRDALEIQRAIEQLKQDTEVEMLRIQKRHAEARGDDACVEYLARAIRWILEPETRTAEPVETTGAGTR
jgi:hypothetical protein